MESRREGGKGGFAGPLARQQAKRAPLSKEDITLSLFQLSPTSTPAHSPSPPLSLSLSLSSFVCWGEAARAERFLLLHTAAPHVQLGTRRARSLLGLDQIQTPSTGLRHPSFKVEEGAGKRCSEGVCMLGGEGGVVGVCVCVCIVVVVVVVSVSCLLFVITFPLFSAAVPRIIMKATVREREKTNQAGK